MASIYLSDEELIEMILERPRIMTMVVEKLQSDIAEEIESCNFWSQRAAELKRETK